MQNYMHFKQRLFIFFKIFTYHKKTHFWLKEFFFIFFIDRLGIIYRISNQYQERNNNFLWKQIISLGRIWCFVTINSFLRQNLILTTQNILFLLKIIFSGPWIMLSRAKIFCQNSAKIIKNLNLEKGAPKLCWAAMTKPRQIECTVFFTGPQRTNLNLQTGFGSIGCMVVEKSRFSDRGWWFGKVCPRT